MKKDPHSQFNLLHGQNSEVYKTPDSYIQPTQYIVSSKKNHFIIQPRKGILFYGYPYKKNALDLQVSKQGGYGILKTQTVGDLVT